MSIQSPRERADSIPTPAAGGPGHNQPPSSLGEPLVEFVIPGLPVPWARARGGSEWGGFYTPARQKAYKRTVGDYCRVALWQAGIRKPLTGAIVLGLRVHLEPPKSWQREKPALWAYANCVGNRATVKPDLDNWAKLPMDAMNNLAWLDDGQVAEFAPGTGKFWHPGRPRLEVDLWEFPL